MASFWPELVVVDVYHVPRAFGGGWAFSYAGTVSDGYGSESEAKRCAAESLRAAGFRGVVRFDVEAEE